MYRVITKEKRREAEREVVDFFKGIELSANFDVIKLCSQFGFRMISLSLPNGIDGVIMVDGETKVIGVSNRVSPVDARFVVAHELAHFIHESQGKGINEVFFAAKDSILHDNEKSEDEDLMDFIAAAILVPKELFLKDLKALGIAKVFSLDETKKIEYGIIENLAKKYNVADKLIMRRIFEVSDYVA